MTRIWLGTCAALTFGLAIGLPAQSPQSTPAKNITVSGCIQRAGESPTGTSGTAGAAGAARATSETKFLLTSAAMSPAGTTGTAGTPPTTAVASEYRLDADDAKLTPHVGHKVEISGVIQEPSSAASSQPPTASAANAPKLKVDTVKMVAPTCP